MDGVDKKPHSKSYMHVVLIHDKSTGNILRTLELKAVVEHICLNESLVSTFTWPRDQSLGCVVIHLLDYFDLWLHLEKTIDFIYTS
jgi:hypothetical protein